jgi:hydroxyacylglutathione hydrolase
MKYVMLWMMGLSACVGSTTSGSAPGDAAAATDARAIDSGTGSGGLMPGSLTVSWMHGSANCAQNADPEVQVHAYNATTYIIRQNKCRTFEAPFVYVLLGAQKALVLDSGATNTTTLRETIKPLVGNRAVTVAHTHAHGDHAAGDPSFSGQPGFTVVGRSLAAVQAAFGISPWPASPGQLDLGGRVLDVIGVPGHEATHVIVYDRLTGLLLTGDTLYPGFLFVNDWTQYRTSIHRLAQFVAGHAISHVLGAHVEMSSTATVGYPYGTTFQPAEHVLQLTAAHVAQLDAALTALGPTPPAQPVKYDDFIIDPQ